jgi:hypothetical protein
MNGELELGIHKFDFRYSVTHCTQQVDSYLVTHQNFQTHRHTACCDEICRTEYTANKVYRK